MAQDPRKQGQQDRLDAGVLRRLTPINVADKQGTDLLVVMEALQLVQHRLPAVINRLVVADAEIVAAGDKIATLREFFLGINEKANDPDEVRRLVGEAVSLIEDDETDDKITVVSSHVTSHHTLGREPDAS